MLRKVKQVQEDIDIAKSSIKSLLILSALCLIVSYATLLIVLSDNNG